ncbi:uncharacterized protein VTP21DRAFT_9610 [Calcarisporiella thermophila]|uniref:uncharacterized protein n=1 Tax=Calcarisporiella thermophila TaxID=911321 RepID=UPI00374493F8
MGQISRASDSGSIGFDSKSGSEPMLFSSTRIWLQLACLHCSAESLGQREIGHRRLLCSLNRQFLQMHEQSAIRLKIFRISRHIRFTGRGLREIINDLKEIIVEEQACLAHSFFILGWSCGENRSVKVLREKDGQHTKQPALRLLALLAPATAASAEVGSRKISRRRSYRSPEGLLPKEGVSFSSRTSPHAFALWEKRAAEEEREGGGAAGKTERLASTSSRFLSGFTFFPFAAGKRFAPC